MSQNDYITLFTSRIGVNPDPNIKLFFNNKKKYENEELLDELFKLLHQNSSCLEDSIKACFDSLGLNDKETAIRNYCTSQLPIEKTPSANQNQSFSLDERLIGIIRNGQDIPSTQLKEIFESQKSFIYEKAGFRYCLFQAIGHNNVFAIDVLSNKRTEKEWISGLYEFAKKINPDATTINLLIHQGDIIEVEEHNYINYTYIFTEQELNEILGDTTGITLNVIAYSHTSECPIYLILRDAYDHYDKKIPSSIDPVHRKISYIKNENMNFQIKLSTTISGIANNSDPIGCSYSKNQ